MARNGSLLGTPQGRFDRELSNRFWFATQVYDIDTFNRMSGRWFMQQYEGMKPYFDMRKKAAEDHKKSFAWMEIEKLYSAVRMLRLAPLPQTRGGLWYVWGKTAREPLLIKSERKPTV
jgi:hypothetical protein